MILAISLLAMALANGATEPAVDSAKTTIKLQMVDGELKPLVPRENVAFAVFDEHGKRLLQMRDSAHSPSFEIKVALDPDRRYVVVARMASYQRAVSCSFQTGQTKFITLKLLFMPYRAQPTFVNPDLQTLQEKNLNLWRLLFAGQSDEQAQTRYQQYQLEKPLALAGYLSIGYTVMAYQLPDGTDLFAYYRAIDWGDLRPNLSIHTARDRHRELENDRFFAWVDKGIVPVLETLIKSGDFKREYCPRLWGHPGATRSYKLAKFDKGNFQITLHEHQTKVIDGVDCILVETDVDYFAQIWRHAFEEVLPHKLFRGLTNPRKVYVIEWRQLQTTGSDFSPPYGWRTAQER